VGRTAGCRARCRLQLGSGTRQGASSASDPAGGYLAIAGIKFIQYVKERAGRNPGSTGQNLTLAGQVARRLPKPDGLPRHF